jgi:Putative phage metallopeptidase
MPHYDSAPTEAYSIAKSTLQHERYRPFREAGVSWSLWMAFANNDEPPITFHGVAALARAKIIRLLDRVKGNTDVEILIDGVWWQNATPAGRSALLAHEFWHFEIITDKRDDTGRPVVRLRKHDYQFGWFNCIAQQYGADSVECLQASILMDKDGQSYWPALVTPASS